MSYTIIDDVSRRRFTMDCYSLLTPSSYETKAGAKIALTAYKKRLQKRIDDIVVGPRAAYDLLRLKQHKYDLQWVQMCVIIVDTKDYLAKCPNKTIVVNGHEMIISADTPACCDPSTETYKCM